jgi:hypothetical protein
MSSVHAILVAKNEIIVICSTDSPGTGQPSLDFPLPTKSCHFLMFSSVVSSQDLAAAMKLGCSEKECLRASRSAGFANGFVRVSVWQGPVFPEGISMGV